ncbi:MAG: Holliday junction resolvase RuvX, partial [Candidatus Limnocylindrales bacterium]
MADGASGTVRALTTLNRRDDDHDATVIQRLIEEHRADELIVGLPLSLDGSDGPQAIATRTWATAMAARLHIPVHLRDERFTSAAAADRLPRPRRGTAGGPPARQVRTAARARIDREAAAGILQAEL